MSVRWRSREIFTACAGATVQSSWEGLALARNDAWHVLVLDVNLPGLDGFSVCRKLREAGDEVPVIFLTARDDPADLREGFTGGGDDYLTKPFSLEELVLRVEAMLRRGRGQANQRTRVAVGDIVLDDDAHRVWRGDREIELSAREFALLETFMRRPGQVLTQPQLLEAAWDLGYEQRSNVVEVYVRYLRRKLGGDVIETVRGMGYCLRR